MKDFSSQRLVKEIRGKFNLQNRDTNICSRVWEDYSGALILGNMKNGSFASQSKHDSIKYHWFCRKLKPNGIKLLKINTSLNKGNIFTKGLPAKMFKI
eukprot:7407071-Ditylum_brightwellii.AAC.1